jgi:peroxiredoxin
LPSLVKLYAEFKDRGFVVVAVDIKEKKELVKRYVEKQNIALPVLLDKDGKVANTYAVRSHPDHFFINRKGELVGKTVGARDWQSAKNRDLIRYLLDQNDGK